MAEDNKIKLFQLKKELFHWRNKAKWINELEAQKGL